LPDKYLGLSCHRGTGANKEDSKGKKPQVSQPEKTKTEVKRNVQEDLSSDKTFKVRITK